MNEQTNETTEPEPIVTDDPEQAESEDFDDEIDDELLEVAPDAADVE